MMVICSLATQFESSAEINICKREIPVIKARAVVINPPSFIVQAVNNAGMGKQQFHVFKLINIKCPALFLCEKFKLTLAQAALSSITASPSV